MRSLKVSLIALALVTAGGVGAAHAQVIPEIGDTANQAKEEANKAAILRLYSSNFDPAVVAELTATDAVTTSAGTTGAGPDGVNAIFAAIKAAVPGAVATVKHATADSDYVLIHWHASATPDDLTSGNAAADIFKLQDGKIVQVWSGNQAAVPSASGNDPFSDLYVYPNGAPTLTEAQEEANRVREEDFNRNMATEPNTPERIRSFWADDLVTHKADAENGNAAILAIFARQQANAGAGGPPPGGAPGGPPPGGAPGGPPPGGGAGGPPPGGMFQTVGYFADGDIVWEVNMIRGNLLADIYRVVDNKVVEDYRVGNPPTPPAPAP